MKDVIYQCKENDAKLKFIFTDEGDAVDEVWIDTGDGSWTVVGMKDMLDGIALANSQVIKQPLGLTPSTKKQPNALLEDMGLTFGECMKLAIAKNSDYGGSEDNLFSNFTNSAIVGVPVEKGIMVRMMDKITRMSTLLEKETKVQNETIEDTLMDLINYAAILKSYLKQK